jgi:hypothetical protein
VVWVVVDRKWGYDQSWSVPPDDLDEQVAAWLIVLDVTVFQAQAFSKVELEEFRTSLCFLTALFGCPAGSHLASGEVDAAGGVTLLSKGEGEAP